MEFAKSGKTSIKIHTISIKIVRIKDGVDLNKKPIKIIAIIP